jgi:hypothetical protein
MLLAFGCQHSRTGVRTAPVTAPDEEYLLGINRDIVRNEATNIRLLIDRYGWNMQGDPAGYYYEILDEGHGIPLKKGDKVMLRCRITLLDGTTVFDSGEDDIKSLVIGRSDEPVGLQEALQRMRHGTKARLILPSHLAYGSLGDGESIPGFAPIVYTLEILD